MYRISDKSLSTVYNIIDRHSPIAMGYEKICELSPYNKRYMISVLSRLESMGAIRKADSTWLRKGRTYVAIAPPPPRPVITSQKFVITNQKVAVEKKDGLDMDDAHAAWMREIKERVSAKKMLMTRCVV